VNKFYTDIEDGARDLLQSLGLPWTLAPDVLAHKYGTTLAEVKKNLKALRHAPPDR